MGTAELDVILALAGVIILLLGIGGGKLLSDKRIDTKVEILKTWFLQLHNACHLSCKKERVGVEKELKEALTELKATLKSFKEETGQMLLIGTFTIDELAKRSGMTEADLARIKTNVKNGTYKKM